MDYSQRHILMIFIAYFIASLISCSVDSIEELPNNNIDLSVISENNWEMSNEILGLINTHRIELGLNSLIKDSSYATAYSVLHSKYMIETQSVNHNNFFKRSNGLKEKGAISVAENVAYGYSNAESVVNAWLNSDGHKEVIEGEFTHLGFGVLKSDINNRIYYTTIFYK